MIKSAANIHAKVFQRFVADAGVVITVRQSKSRTAGSSAMDKVYGATNQETEPDPDLDKQVKVIWSTDTTLLSSIDNPQVMRQLGGLGLLTKDIDIVARAYITNDILHTKDDNLSLTIFDTAFDIVKGVESYKVQGTAKTGLPPIGPYVLWVALKRV